MAHEPRFTTAYLQLGVEADLIVQDSSAFAAQGEALSYLQARVLGLAVVGWLARGSKALHEGVGWGTRRAPPAAPPPPVCPPTTSAPALAAA